MSLKHPFDRTAPLSQELRLLAERYEASWRDGPPELAKFLSTTGQTRPSREILTELVAIDLEQRWLHPTGQDVEKWFLEDYANKFPDLGPTAELPLQLVVHEYRVRRRSGDAPDHRGYTERFSLDEAQLRAALERADQELAHGSGETCDATMDQTTVSTPSASARGTADARFQIVRFHARGGLGEISLARDTELNRDVALKEIQSRFAHDPQCRARFLLEAEVCGGLEHPGVVPVYGMGTHADGRPYYAMRFIEGESLAAAVDRMHETKPTKAQQEPSNNNSRVEYDSIEFRQLLSRLIDVCNAIEYSHSRGVLHRDLKPGNIMLGKYGETLVVDWGLAKVRRDREGSDEQGPSARWATGANDQQATVAGAAMGTPAFMPPEQAAGAFDELGPASDVYGLGATLYYALTGRPPFRGRDMEQVLQAVRDGRFPPPRQLNVRIPKPLEAICLKAMATRAVDRYASPRAMSDDLERYLADEPLPSLAEPWTSIARRWMRKHPAITATSAAVVLLTVMGLTTFSFVLNAKNTKLALLNTDLRRTSLREIQAREQAEENARIAGQQSQLSLATLGAVVSDIQTSLKDLPGGGDVRRRLLTIALEKLQLVSTQFIAQAAIDLKTCTGVVELGDVVLRFGANADDVAEADNSTKESAFALADDLYSRGHSIAQRLADSAPQDADAQRVLAVTLQKLADLNLLQGKTADAFQSYQASLDILERLSGSRPEHEELQRTLAGVVERAGMAALQMGDTAAAETYFRRQLALTESIAQEKVDDLQAQRDWAMACNKIAMLKMQLGDMNAAIEGFEQSRDIRQRALTLYPESLALRHDLAGSNLMLGDLYFQNGRLDRAGEYYQQSLAASTMLHDADPANTNWKREHSNALERVAAWYEHSNQLDAAAEHYHQMLSIKQELVDANPEDMAALRELGVAKLHLGNVAARAGRLPEAEQRYREFLAACQQIAQVDSVSMYAKQDLARAHRKLADLFTETRDFKQAVDQRLRVLEVDQQMKELQPNSRDIQLDLASDYQELARNLLSRREHVASAEAYRKAAQALRELVAQDPNDAESATSAKAFEEAAKRVLALQGEQD